MPRLITTLLSVTLLGLAGCSGQETPRPAMPVVAQPTHADLGGGLRVHFNLLPTLAMNDAVARSYGVGRERNQALLVVALRRLGDGEEHPTAGRVEASAVDLSGKRQQIALREVRTGAYTDLIGLVQAHPHDQLRIDLQVDAEAGKGSIRFDRSF